MSRKKPKAMGRGLANASVSSSSVSTEAVKGRGVGSNKKKKTRGVKRERDSQRGSSSSEESSESDSDATDDEADMEVDDANASSDSSSDSSSESSPIASRSNQPESQHLSDVTVDEKSIDEIIIRVDELVKPFPLDHPFQRMHGQLKKQYERIKNNTISVVFCAKRGEGKSETTNYCAVSLPKLKSEGFPELFGCVPLESALRATSVTSIPAWLEYLDGQPECLIKLSDGQEIEIYDVANERWKASDEARIPKIARASSFIRTLLVFKFANTNAKALVRLKIDDVLDASSSNAASASASASASSASSEASPAAAHILHMTLKWKWSFGNRFRFGDTLGWEDAATNDLNAALMNEADVFGSVTSRAISNDELKSLIEHGAFSKNSNTQRRSTFLMSFYRTSETTKENSNASSNPLSFIPSNEEPQLNAQQLFHRALNQTLQDPSIMTNMTRDWQERYDMFQSLQMNAVLCGYDRNDPESTDRLVQQALRGTQDKFMEQKHKDFIKETSSLVFCVNRKLNHHTGKSRSGVYTTAELRKRSAQKPSLEKEIKGQLSETVFDEDFDPHDFGSFPMPKSQAAADFQARKVAVFAAGNMFSANAIGNASALSSSNSSSSSFSHSSSSFVDQVVLYRVNQLYKLLLDQLAHIRNNYCLNSLQALVNRVEENNKLSRETEEPVYMDVDDGSAQPLSPKVTPAKKSAKVREGQSTPKKKAKIEQDTKPTSSSSSAAAAGSRSSSLAASPSQRQSSIDSAALDSPHSVMSALLNSGEIQKPIADLFELLQAGIHKGDVYDILVNAVMFAQNEVVDEFEMGMRGVGSNGEDLTPDEQEAQYRPSVSDRAIDFAYDCIQDNYIAKWIKQFEQAAETAWGCLKHYFEELESDGTKIQVESHLQSDAKLLCQQLKQLSNKQLERAKQKQQIDELSRGGTFADAIRVSGLPRAHRLYDSLEALIGNRKSPSTEAEFTNAESHEFRTKCPSMVVTTKIDGKVQGINVILQTREPVSIQALLSQSTTERIETFRTSMSDIHFGTEHHGKTDPKTRSLFPVYTPLFLTCEVDAQAFVRGSDYDGMKHMLFVSVERGQQQQWLEKAMTDQAVEGSSIVLVSIASSDPTIHLDVLRSLLTSFGFQYAWRRTMNFKNVNELQPILFSTFPCATSFAMISMQQVMKDLYRHTVILFARAFTPALISKARRLIFSLDIPESKQEHLLTIIDEVKRAVANVDNSKPSSTSSTTTAASSAASSSASIKFQASSTLDGAATITEMELRELASALRVVNSKADSVFTSLLEILQPYFSCGMMTAFPKMFLLHGYLPIYPDLHKVHASSTRMHSLVFEHLPALSHVPFNTPKDAKSAADRYQLARSLLPATLTRQELIEKKVDFEMLTLRAEQRCKERIHGKKLCVPHILCASFGLGLSKYTANTKKKSKKPGSGKRKTSNAEAAAAALTASAPTHASPSPVRQTFNRTSSNTKVKREQ